MNLLDIHTAHVILRAHSIRGVHPRPSVTDISTWLGPYQHISIKQPNWYEYCYCAECKLLQPAVTLMPVVYGCTECGKVDTVGQQPWIVAHSVMFMYQKLTPENAYVIHTALKQMYEQQCEIQYGQTQPL